MRSDPWVLPLGENGASTNRWTSCAFAPPRRASLAARQESAVLLWAWAALRPPPPNGLSASISVLPDLGEWWPRIPYGSRTIDGALAIAPVLTRTSAPGVGWNAMNSVFPRNVARTARASRPCNVGAASFCRSAFLGHSSIAEPLAQPALVRAMWQLQIPCLHFLMRNRY